MESRKLPSGLREVWGHENVSVRSKFCSFNVDSRNGMNLLMYASVGTPRRVSLQWLFHEDKFDKVFHLDVNMQDFHGWTALHHACASKAPSMHFVKALLDLGANVDAETDDTRETALDMAKDGTKQLRALLELYQYRSSFKSKWIAITYEYNV